MKINQRRLNGEGSTFIKIKGRKGLLKQQIRLEKNGQPKRFRVYGKSKGELRNKMNELKWQVEAGLRHCDGTMAEYLTQWYPDEIEEPLRPSTISSRRSSINRMIPYIGNIKLIELDHIAVKTMNKILKRKYASSTANLTYVHLGTALNNAVTDDLIAKNPCRNKVKAPKIENKKILASSDQILSIEERDKLAAISDRWSPLFIVISVLGLRIGEALGLQWKHIDFTRGKLSIKQQVIMSAKQWTLVPPKTAESIRDINMPRGVVRALRVQKDRVHFTKEREVTNDDFVFSNKKVGTPMKRQYIGPVLTRSLKMIGVDRKIRPHDLRLLLSWSNRCQPQGSAGNPGTCEYRDNDGFVCPYRREDAQESVAVGKPYLRRSEVGSTANESKKRGHVNGPFFITAFTTL